MTTSPLERATDAFAAELARHRTGRGLTKKQLATMMGFDPSYVSHVEGRRHRPTEDFARRAEAVLDAGGVIWQRFREYDRLRQTRAAPGQREPTPPGRWLPPGTGLVVERETASLTLVDGTYRCVVRRRLHNAGTEPVTRYLVRVAVDRWPDDPTRSNRHHREHPLTFAELRFRAVHHDGGAREPMHWRVRHDRDAYKEIWLLFENADGPFPLHPGERADVEYAYRVGRVKWGPWFQRAVRLPTRHLAVRLDLPAALDPRVWGVETSLSADEGPLRTPVRRHDRGDRVVFDWSTEDPPLNTRFRLQWRFRQEPAETTAPVPTRPAEQLRALGVLAPEATPAGQPARPFDLPREATAAREVVDRLTDLLTRADELHPFSAGMGLAAPQLGLDAAVAVVRPADRDAPPVVLVNPRVVGESPDTVEQYEGCLATADHRGLVPRPLRIDVEHARWDGGQMITSFAYGMARLVAHEIDHLEGRSWTDRMPPGVPLVPVEEYRESNA
ncbi:peptide deformylase [Micromonospora rifamycinica]|uniref:peptide deformylase n=1 Tax=Micromonospora rifamycinica TaxID=291594 RepID=UPI002E2B21CC|nr:peptide deformylase [Micromonospora rifamycinica]